MADPVEANNRDVEPVDNTVTADSELGSDETKNVEITDKRFLFATKDEVEFHGDFETDELNKVRSTKMLERQAEARKEKTDELIQRFHEKEIELNKRRMWYLFRAVARVIMMAASLKSYGASYFERIEGAEKTQEAASSLPVFDVNLYRKKKQVQVSSKVKRMMAKPSWLRTDKELNLIFQSLLELDFFNKYHQTTLRGMAPVINYQKFEPNRVILRQGHMPVSFYFVLSGTLLVHVDEKDEYGLMTSRQVGKIGVGKSFGELALIHNTPRTATVTSESETELLVMDKEDFDLLFKDTAEHFWLYLYGSMCNLPAFQSWGKDQLEHCSNHSKLIKYDNNKVVVGNIEERPEHVYFVADGKCRVVEVVRFVACPASKTHGGVTITPVPPTTKAKDALLNQPVSSTIVRRFLHIMTLSKGDCFSVGEDLLERYVVSWGKAECLQIPLRYLQLQGHSSWLALLREKLKCNIPTHKHVYDEFMLRATWRAYKKDLISQLQQRSKKSCLATIEDVPISIQNDEAIENWNTIIINR